MSKIKEDNTKRGIQRMLESIEAFIDAYEAFRVTFAVMMKECGMIFAFEVRPEWREVNEFWQKHGNMLNQYDTRYFREKAKMLEEEIKTL